jgi:hypothetical protein
LSRHELIHTYPDNVILHTSQNNSTNAPRKNKACLECAKARARCSKESVCGRCKFKSLHCTYPERNKNRGTISERFPVEYETEESTPITTSSTPAVEQDESFAVMPSHNPYPMIVQDSIPSGSDLGAINNDSRYEANFHQAATHVAIENAINDTEMDTFQTDNIFQDETNSAQNSHQPLSTGNLNHFSQNANAMEFQMMYSPGTDSSNLHASINWLPTNFNCEIDYSSILGLSQCSAAPTGGLIPPSIVPLASGARQSIVQAIDDDVSISEMASTTSHPITSPAFIDAEPHNCAKGTQGSLYATSTDGARAPCSFKPRESLAVVHREKTVPISHRGVSDYAFPNLTNVLIEGYLTNNDILNLIDPTSYEAIRNGFEYLCLKQDSMFRPFQSQEFPLCSHLNYFAYLYFRRFHPILPILHKATINLNDYWPLALAVAAIGCQYAGLEEFSNSISPTHEFLRRVIAMEIEKAPKNNIGLPLLQTIILNTIGLRYCKVESAFDGSKTYGQLLDIVHNQELLAHEPNDLVTETRIYGWSDWILLESRRRIGYTIWVRLSFDVIQINIHSYLTRCPDISLIKLLFCL